MSLRRHLRDASILAAAAVGGAPVRGTPRVSYGRALPPRGAEGGGGLVKFQRLQVAYPPTVRKFNLLYLGSNTLPRTRRPLLALARRRRIPLVWNQDGVAYPGWHGPGWEAVNRPMAEGLALAAHVFFQSEFCRLSADRFLGPPGGTWEVLHNAVDTDLFTPVTERPVRPLTLVLGGNQYQRYRFETAVQTVARLDDARLLVTGHLTWARGAEGEGREVVRRLGLSGRVEFAGPYAQRDAPALLRRGDLLLHTKVNDPCPSVVVEAMACGLPVVYAASGGVPELVGEEGGIGIPTPLDWERDRPPAPDALAEAVQRVAARLPEFAVAARRRAVELFDLEAWIERHRVVFERLAA